MARRDYTNVLGQVGFQSRIVQGSFTRPADTNAYASGDVMNDSTSAPTVAQIANVARVPGRGGLILDAYLHSSQNATAQPIDVFLFSATIVAPGNDNAAFTPSDAEMLTLLGVLQFTVARSIIANAGAAAAGNRVWELQDVYRPFQCAANSVNLFWVPVARGAYAPVASEVFTLVLGVQQD